MIGICCGAVAHKLLHLRALDPHSKGYLLKVSAAAGSGLLLNVFTDPLLGYFRNVYIFGQQYTVAQALSKVAGGVTLVNSIVSTICAVALYLALRPALERANLLPKHKYIFGQQYTVAQALSKVAGGVTLVNSIVSTICAVALYLALRPALERANLLPKHKN